MSQANDHSLDAAILTHAAACKRGAVSVAMWLIGLLLVVAMGATSWAYTKSSQISVLESRVDGVQRDIGEINVQLQALPRIETKLDRAIGKN